MQGGRFRGCCLAALGHALFELFDLFRLQTGKLAFHVEAKPFAEVDNGLAVHPKGGALEQRLGFFPYCP